MTEIRAEQLVFARVEPCASPKRRTGFQTVYHSPGLSPALVAEIERHVRCFGYRGHPDDEHVQSLERLQFARLAEERFLLSRSTPAAHTEYIDKGNRPGTFIVHCLICAASELRKVYNDPFAVFDQEHLFVTDAESLLERFVENADFDPVLSIPIPRSGHFPGEDTGGWKPDEFRKLLRLAAAAKRLVQRKKSVVFRGESPDEVEAALRLVFRHLPDTRARAYCTFSTHIDGCTVAAGDYWAVATNRRLGRDFSPVDVDQQVVVETPNEPPPEPNSLFARWLEDTLSRQCPREAYQPAFTIEHLAAAYEEDEPLRDPDDLSREACTEFYLLFASEVAARIESRLRALLSRRIAKPLQLHVVSRHEPAELTLLGAEPETRITEQIAANWVQQWILEASTAGHLPRLRSADWEQLRHLASRVENWPLLHWSAALDRVPLLGSLHGRQCAAALKNMDEPSFLAALRLLGTVPAARFVSAEQLQLLLETVDFRRLSSSDFLALVKAILRLPVALPDLNPLRDALVGLRAADVRGLQKLCGERKARVDEQFLRALASLGETAGGKRGRFFWSRA